MVDFLRMFRRRGPAPGRQGFARSRPDEPRDITSLSERMGDLFKSVIGEKPLGTSTTAREPAPAPREAVVAVAAPRDPPLAPRDASAFTHDAPPIPRAAPRADFQSGQTRDTAPRSRTGNGAAKPRAQHSGYLAIHGVEKSFGNRKIVRGVSIYVRRGEAVGILGPNGAGKTTVFYMITGLIKPDAGRV